VIRGYTALLNEVAFGLPVTAFLRVRLQPRDSRTVAAFEAAVDGASRVRERRGRPTGRGRGRLNALPAAALPSLKPAR